MTNVPTATKAVHAAVFQFVMEPTGVKMVLATKLPEFLV
jgi:hypothetical protein